MQFLKTHLKYDNITAAAQQYQLSRTYRYAIGIILSLCKYCIIFSVKIRKISLKQKLMAHKRLFIYAVILAICYLVGVTWVSDVEL